MKHRTFIYILILCAALCLAFTGCRTRVISAPELADSVLPLPSAPEPPEPSAPNVTPPPSEEPQTTPPPPHEIPRPEESEPTPAAEKSPPPPETPEPAEPPPSPVETPPPASEIDAEPAEPDAEAEYSLPELAGAIDAHGAALLREQTEAGITVIYDPNGGDSATASTVVRPGEPYGAQPEAVWRGHALSGWWTEPEGGSQVFPDTVVTAEENHTLYAHWECRDASAIVTFDGNGGRVKSREAKLSISEGDAFGTLPVPLREGFELLGWFTAQEDGDQITPESVFSGTDDLVLYAHWSYDPFVFWTFTLQNKTQQIYLCQQASFYFETQEDHVTRADCGLISATGSLNVAEYRDDPVVTDDWVLAKRPDAIIKCVDDMGAASAAAQELAERFPGQRTVIVTSAALGNDAAGLYARLALAKEFYGDWYTDVDLNTVAAELSVTDTPIWL